MVAAPDTPKVKTKVASVTSSDRVQQKHRPPLELIDAAPVTPKVELIVAAPVTPKVELIVAAPVTPKVELIVAAPVTLGGTHSGSTRYSQSRVQSGSISNAQSGTHSGSTRYSQSRVECRSTINLQSRSHRSSSSNV